MAAKSFLRLVSGIVTVITGTVVSTGAPNDGDIVALDSTGKIDVSVLPIGVGPDVTIVPAFEALGAGKYVNIFLDTGVAKARLADNSNNRPAHGWVKASVTIGANATIYFEGPNDGLTGLTIGAREYLGTAGGATETPVTAGIHQLLGVAINATTINTDIEDKIVVS